MSQAIWLVSQKCRLRTFRGRGTFLFLFIFFFHSLVNFPSLYPVLETLQGNRDSSGLVLGVIPKLSLFTSFSRVLPTSSMRSRCKNPEKHSLLLNKMFNSLLVFNFNSLPSLNIISVISKALTRVTQFSRSPHFHTQWANHSFPPPNPAIINEWSPTDVDPD